MGKAKYRDLPDLGHLAQPGAEIAVKATPKAARDRIVAEGGALRAYVTTAPENGKANAAIRNMLAAAMGVAPSDLNLIRGQTSREKFFRYRGLGAGN